MFGASGGLPQTVCPTMVLRIDGSVGPGVPKVDTLGVTRERAQRYTWLMASSTLSRDARRAGSEAAIRPAIVAITT
jgi:hypothetical protein